jgi:hydroxypyruvate reductase
VDGVVRAVLVAAEPGAALRRAWPPDEAERATLAGAVLLAAGKASVAMARAAVEELGVKGGGGVVVGPAGSRAPASFASAGLRLFEADHPLPTQRNMIAAQAVADAARLASSRKLPVVLLLSGGASAHLTLPERGLTLSDVRAVTDALLKAGATIGELNAVRKRIEMLKGGGLARLAAPSGVYVFVLSDVLGDRVDVIGSGPAAEDATTDEGALDVLASRGVEGAAPNVVEFLRKRVKAKGLGMGGPPRAPVTNSVHTVVGSNAMAVEAARRQLEAAGFVIEEARSGVEGEAAEMGRLLAERVLGVRRGRRRAGGAGSRPGA